MSSTPPAAGRSTGRGTSGASTTPAPRTTTPGTPTPGTSGPATSAAVPLVTCPTTYGVGPASTPSLPTTVTVTVPGGLVATVAVYTDAQGDLRVLGPTGWSCQALIGADGSSSVLAHPPGEVATGGRVGPTDQALFASQTGGCAGCAIDQACPLFPAAAQLAASEGMPCTAAPPQGETVDRLSPTEVAFDDPAGVAGDGVPSGGPYPADGVMTYVGAAGQQRSYLATCTLPASQHDLCTASLDLFSGAYGSL